MALPLPLIGAGCFKGWQKIGDGDAVLRPCFPHPRLGDLQIEIGLHGAANQRVQFDVVEV